MESDKLIAPPTRTWPCVSLIGMAGCGKSTVAASLARDLDWAMIDNSWMSNAA